MFIRPKDTDKTNCQKSSEKLMETTASQLSFPQPAARPGESASTRVPYPWVPEQLCEHHQVSRGEGKAHVGGRDGQHCHGVPLRQLELLAQGVPVRGGRRAINANVLHVLQQVRATT